MDDRPRSLTVRQVAERLGVTDGTVRSWIRAGQLPAHTRTGQTRPMLVKPQDLKKFIDAGDPVVTAVAR